MVNRGNICNIFHKHLNNSQISIKFTEYGHMANKIMKKKSQIVLAIRKIQMQNTISQQQKKKIPLYVFTEWSKSKTLIASNAAEDIRHRNFHSSLVGVQNGTATWKITCWFLQI